MAGLAVSLIACPCALGLATPLAVWSAIGQAAEHQVLFRSGEALERLADIRAVRFDKTGTLTTGTAIVQACQAEHPDDREAVLARAAALAGFLVARPVAGHRRSSRGEHMSAPRLSTEQVRVVPGRGVVGTLKAMARRLPVSLGSPWLMDERGLHLGPVLRDAAEQARDAGLSMAMVGWNEETRGLFVFNEQWRPGLCRCHRLAQGHRPRRRGPDGRSRRPGPGHRPRAGGRRRGRSAPGPEGRGHRRAQRRLGPVAMVGDGVNDAPALAASDVGIALGCGTDVSRDSAAICLLGDDLTRIPWTIELARRTIRVIRRNLFWAFAYNTLGVIAAALGWLNPAVAALLMVASSAMVIGNSLRLRQPLSLDPGRSARAPDAAESLSDDVLADHPPVALEITPR